MLISILLGLTNSIGLVIGNLYPSIGGGDTIPDDLNLGWWVKADGELYTDAARTDLVDTNLDPIGSATDESGQGNNFSQPTTANKYEWTENLYNGLPAMRSDDTNQISLIGNDVGVSTNQTDEVHYVMAFRLDQSILTNSFDTLISESNSTASNFFQLYRQKNGNLFVFDIIGNGSSNASFVFGPDPFITGTDPKVIILSFLPALSEIRVYVDGVETVNRLTGVPSSEYPLGSTGVRIGTVDVGSVVHPITGDFCEGYRVDGPIDIAANNAYVAGRWQ